MKVWYQSVLDFGGHADYAAALTERFDAVRAPATEIGLHGRGDAAHALSNSEVIGSPATYFRIIPPVFLDALVTAQREGADVFAIGSFSEPIVAELRALAEIPVVTMPEAAMLLACTVAPKFALVSISRIAAQPFLGRTVKMHGLAERISGIHVVDEVFSEEEVHAQFREPAAYMQRFMAACRIAVAAGAQAIVPAEGMLAAMATNFGISEVDGAPVIDSVGATVLFAEMAARLRASSGFQQSRLAYPRPSARAIEALFG